MPKSDRSFAIEFRKHFYSRGLGFDRCNCFVCGTDDRTGKGHFYLNNIAAFVENKAAGQDVVAMFEAEGSSAWLDYRKHEPDYVQVKVGACDLHLPNLERLNQLTVECNSIITREMIRQAINL